ncbi:MAG: hypothetical protein RIR29_815, partial [Actinomycetota bacterium]
LATKVGEVIGKKIVQVEIKSINLMPASMKLDVKYSER